MLKFARVAYPMVAIPGKAERKDKKDEAGRVTGEKFYVELTTAYGLIGSEVPQDVYEQAKRLEKEQEVVVDVLPVNEQQRSQFAKAGYVHRLVPQRISKLEDHPATSGKTK